MLSTLLGGLIHFFEWFFSLPSWVLIPIVIGLIALRIFVRPSNDSSGSNGYSGGSMDNSDSYERNTYDTKDFQMKDEDHPFVFYDYAGNRCSRGSVFYDSKGNRCNWGSGFYDGKGIYRNWGDNFYDANGELRAFGDCFYDTQGKIVYPNW